MAKDGAGADAGLVVFLHGHESSPDELGDMAGRLELPASWVVVVPAAAGHGTDAASSWFDTGPRGVDADGVDRSARHLEGLIDGLLADSGLDRANLVVGGFSQGAAMALVLAARGTIAGSRLLVQSGWIPEGPGVEVDLAGAALESAFVQASKNDAVVPAELSLWAADALTAAGTKVEHREYPGGHAMSTMMCVDAGAWIQRR